MHKGWQLRPSATGSENDTSILSVHVVQVEHAECGDGHSGVPRCLRMCGVAWRCSLVCLLGPHLHALNVSPPPGRVAGRVLGGVAQRGRRQEVFLRLRPLSVSLPLSAVTASFSLRGRPQLPVGGDPQGGLPVPVFVWASQTS